MCKNIEILHEIIETLEPIPSFVDFETFSAEGYKEYKVTNGEMKSHSLFNSDVVAVAKTFISKGAVLDAHVHPDSTELIVIMDGELQIHSGRKAMMLPKFSSIKIDKNINHSAVAVEDTWFIAITIPRDYGFPE